MTLTYSHGQAHVWIDDLSSDRDPHAYDMCERHGERLTPPQGWRVLDRRSPGSAALVAV